METITEQECNTQNEMGRGRTLINFRPVLFCAFFLGAGIVYARAVYRGVSAWWLCALFVLYCALLFVRDRRSIKQTFLRCTYLALSFVVGFAAYALQIRNFMSGGQYNDRYFVCGRVETCILDGDLCRVTLSDLEMDGNAEKGKLIAYLPYTYYEKVSLSDRLAVYGKVKRFDVDTEDAYFAYAVEADMRFQMNGESAVVMDSEFRFFPYLRNRIQTTLFSCMDETTASVTLAVLTGDDVFMDSGLLDNFRRGGIAHIFAVSGLHVGALFGFALALMKTKLLKCSPKLLRFTLVATLLLFYGAICGYSASVIRAIVMCLLTYAFSLIGLITDTGENIGAAAIVVLLLSPVSLFTTGFQLSFAACFGIAWLSRPIMQRLVKPIPVREDGETSPLTVRQSAYRAACSFFAVTISAQLATAPIQLMTFGYLSGWSIITNCIFVPLISAVFSIFLLLVTVACLFPIRWAMVILYVPNVIWSALLLTFEIFDFSGFAITEMTVGAGSIICYYLSCSFITDKWRLNKSVKRILFACAMLACVTAVLAQTLTIP